MKNNNWTIGEVDGYKYWAKVFEEGSIYGIDGGRISILEIRNPEGQTILNYSRGWDVTPTEDEDFDYASFIINKFN